MAEWLQGHGVDLVVCAGFMQLLRRPFLDLLSGPRREHAPGAAARLSGLEADRGRARGRRVRDGATVHFVDEGVDLGP